MDTNWKQRPDKTQKSTPADHLDPIQSIANVLNHHHQQKQKQQATRKPRQESPPSTSDQQQQSAEVEQGNSYLYAYNDFVSSGSKNHVKNKHLSVCQFASASQVNQHESALIDSDEEDEARANEDVLSYILNQQQQQLNKEQHQPSACKQFYPQQAYLADNNLDISAIHHLSCSRSSHPRHICGIGGSQHDHLNSIASRLKEQSRRAFLLNQRPSLTSDQSPGKSQSQSKQLLSEIAAIQQQHFSIATGGEKVSENNYLHLNQPLATRRVASQVSSGATGEPAIATTSSSETVNDSASSSDHSRPNSDALVVPLSRRHQQQKHQHQHRKRQVHHQVHHRARPLSNGRSSGSLASWLFCCLCNLITPGQASANQATSSSSKQRRAAIKQQIQQQANESSNIATSSMFSTVGGQSGAYYTTQAPQMDYHSHQHHYPISSDESLGSSAFAHSAHRRMSALFRGCCSKKCLFFTCVMLILLIFIFVIGLSVYLNFLINMNKTNLTPLSGRLKVDSQGDTFNDLLANRTSKEFLLKQAEYETILRGAFDRTQQLLKSYPNHLVKCEVYSFKQGSLWVYFRLFINKRTLMQDPQLMKRKSPDEHIDRQFLPRLTQQTLHAGFEQLMSSSSSSNKVERRSRSSQVAELRQARSSSSSSKSIDAKSFDEKLTRLMPIIESIDLQSIQVTPEYDMLHKEPTDAIIISDNLRASQFLTTTPAPTSSAPPATISSTRATSNSTSTSTTRPPTISSVESSSSGEVSVSSGIFTLANYKENTTRPTTSSRPALVTSQQVSPYLTNLNQKPATQQPKVTTTERVVPLIFGQPVVSQNIKPQSNHNTSTLSRGAALFDGIARLQNSTQNDTLQIVAPYQKIEFPQQPDKKVEIHHLWDAVLNGSNRKNATSAKILVETPDNQAAQQPARRLITSTTIGGRANNSLEFQFFTPEIANAIREQMANASGTSSSTTTNPSVFVTTLSTQKPPKISPHQKQGGSLLVVTSNSRSQQDPQSAILLNRDFHSAAGSVVGSIAAPLAEGQQQVAANSSRLATKPTTSTLNQQRLADSARNNNSTTESAPLQHNKLRNNNKPKHKNKKQPENQKNETISNGPSARKPLKVVAADSNSSIWSQKPSDHLAPTQPTTIELTRSTSSGAPRQTTAMPPQLRLIATSNANQTEPILNLNETIRPATILVPIELANSLQAPPVTRPGTTSFSSQWRPISGDDSRPVVEESSSRNRTRSGSNLALIVGPERLPASLNVHADHQGSHSPFEMSPGLLMDPQPTPRTLHGQRFEGIRMNGQRIRIKPQATVGSRAGPQNEFESHRVSRMRLGDNNQNIFGSSSTTTTTSTASSLSLDSNTRIVDDFMITTDKIEGNTRGSTLIPPLVMSSLADPIGRLKSLDGQPKKTRGPFAFETLKDILAEDGNPPQQDELAIRSERSAARPGADQKLLIRKKLFVDDDGDSLELSYSPSTNPPPMTVEMPKSQVGNFQATNNDDDQPFLTEASLDRFGHRNQPPKTGLTSVLLSKDAPFRCQFHGCKSKLTAKYTCLNQTQICDDYIDCQDESDELDCVSLLKYEPKSKSLGFSNGNGIIYLNRKGSLAPMCVEFDDETGSRSNHSNLSETDYAKKRQEFIRQVNTIGQYACSSQSFSKLVSVKINHHDFVDDANIIKTSKLFHRLSIIDTTAGTAGDPTTSESSYRTGSSNYEVQISSSSECPSKRTVFVKCGAFECGQDSFNLKNQRNSINKGPALSDFPWLVKLFRHGTALCHGYLIDEQWLITSSSCFANPSNQPSTLDGLTAEISYEHYGNDDYVNIETNLRNISDIIAKPSNANFDLKPSQIVLAKLERPVRFRSDRSSTRDLSQRQCATATLAPSQPQSQDLMLNRVEVNRLGDCLSDSRKDLDDLICVSEPARDGSVKQRDDNSTKVLICAETETNRSKPKWTVIGIQTKLDELAVDSTKLLFSTVSSQLDWIVDMINPKFRSQASEDRFGSRDEMSSEAFPLPQDQTCNQFKCSSGECLSWSRICDGIFDCSSQTHDDERDCHK